jgi:hypothetical protein
LLVASGLGLAVALTSALSVASFSGIDVADAAISKGKSFLELMSQRSPGERKEAHLIKTKHRHFRVLAERIAPEIPPPALYKPLVDVFAPPPVMFSGLPNVPIFSSESPMFPPAIFKGPPGAFVSPCCGGGGGGGGGPPAQPPPPPIPAVPEPGTWSTMILGFGLSGWVLRRRRRLGGSNAPI